MGRFVDAAKILKKQGVNSRFALVGAADEYNPSCIDDRQLQEGKEEGTVEIWGHGEDMPAV